MQAVATLLDRNADDQTQEMWQALEKACGISGVKIPKDPHFSWFVAEKFDEARLKARVAELVHELTCFEINANGVGLFTGERPILYIPIVKTRQLLETHERIWDLLAPLGENRSEVYSPDSWIPHITIASDESSLSSFGCILDALFHQQLTMTIPVNNISLIYSDELSAGINFVQEFGKGTS